MTLSVFMTTTCLDVSEFCYRMIMMMMMMMGVGGSEPSVCFFTISVDLFRAFMLRISFGDLRSYRLPLYPHHLRL